MLLEQVPYVPISIGRSVQVPRHGMATAPVTVGLSTYLQSHPYPISCIELGAPHLGQLPARSQIPRSHLRVRLESTAGQDNGLGGNFPEPLIVPYGPPHDPATAVDGQASRLGLM